MIRHARSTAAVDVADRLVGAQRKSTFFTSDTTAIGSSRSEGGCATSSKPA